MNADPKPIPLPDTRQNMLDAREALSRAADVLQFLGDLTDLPREALTDDGASGLYWLIESHVDAIRQIEKKLDMGKRP